MSGFSASAKTFTITILAGLAAISLQADAMKLGVIAMICATTFLLVDTYYMTLESCFRRLYAEVVARNLEQSTDLSITRTIKVSDVINALRSPSIWLFYGPVLVACTLLIGYGMFHEQGSERLPQSDSPRIERRTEAAATIPSERAEPSAQFTAPIEGSAPR